MAYDQGGDSGKDRARNLDEDWVGTPPEGRISRDRARPEHWQRSFPAVQVFFGLLAVLVVVVLVLALS